MKHRLPTVLVASFALLGTGQALQSLGSPPVAADGLTSRLHEQEVMKSKFCAECHPAIYAEHEMNTHGRAFTDEEVRLATGRFGHGDCIVCHTPRPIFETGIGMNPRRRHYDLEAGNTCMTCHWKADHDYGSFKGGADCLEAFDDRVGRVEACASCHRNHGTPYQWELSPLGKAKDRECIDCHMSLVTRPVAVGEEPRRVRSHVFPGGRDEGQLRKAYGYTAEVQGDEVVVTIKNRGAGHNFPTELKQRSLESVVVVRDLEGKEIARSRLVCRDPYKRPYGLHLPVNTQIPSGGEVQHRVPLNVAAGTVECDLFYKLYFPIDDHHPDLARRLEVRRLVFDGVTPANREVDSAPDVPLVVPEGVGAGVASPANLVDFARPQIGQVEVDIPEGNSPEDIAALISLFQFPVPAGGAAARRRLQEIGEPAIPALIEALGSWDNKTYNQALAVLAKLGQPAIQAALSGLSSDQLYIRLHCRVLLTRMSAGSVPGVQQALLAGLVMNNALDRAGSAEAIGQLGLPGCETELRKVLQDRDPDVVREAAFALSRVGDTDSIAAIKAALGNFIFVETRRDLAVALARLGDASGVLLLMEGLDHSDDLVRERFFEEFFGVTGLHFGYDPLAPRPERLEAIARLQAYWAAKGDAGMLQPWRYEDPAQQAEMWSLIKKLASGDPKQSDDDIMERMLQIGDLGLSMLVQGLKYPPGFHQKRALICEALGVIGSPEAAPALVTALRDPVVYVAVWACWALEKVGDPEVLPSVQRLYSRVQTMVANGTFPHNSGDPDEVIAQIARTRLKLGERQAARDLLPLLLSQSLGARQLAAETLMEQYGVDHGYDPEGEAADRRAAAKSWAEEVR